MRISKKWLAMAEMYKRFAEGYPQADFSEAAALAMYEHESSGKPIESTGRLNGFELGKKWMDVTVATWKEDIPCRALLVQELIEDGYPEWFLERVGVLHLRAEYSKCAWWLKPFLSQEPIPMNEFQANWVGDPPLCGWDNYVAVHGQPMRFIKNEPLLP